MNRSCSRSHHVGIWLALYRVAGHNHPGQLSTFARIDPVQRVSGSHKELRRIVAAARGGAAHERRPRTQRPFSKANTSCGLVANSASRPTTTHRPRPSASTRSCAPTRTRNRIPPSLLGSSAQPSRGGAQPTIRSKICCGREQPSAGLWPRRSRPIRTRRTPTRLRGRRCTGPTTDRSSTCGRCTAPRRDRGRPARPRSADPRTHRPGMTPAPQQVKTDRVRGQFTFG